MAINSLNMNVESFDYVHPFYHAMLTPDTPRAAAGYAYDMTQHGRYRIRAQGSGDMMSRRFDPSSRMNYDYSEGVYRLSALLKQGSYNYQYLAVPKGTVTGLTRPVEGDFYQTDNEYLVLVYYKIPGARYAPLIGAALITLESDQSL